ncbi:hypothetical protein PMAYCL1PPCAC_10173, partial [Pristionchus mayeri]
ADRLRVQYATRLVLRSAQGVLLRVHVQHAPRYSTTCGRYCKLWGHRYELPRLSPNKKAAIDGEENRRTLDIAMNYLVSHLTRKPPLMVKKIVGHWNSKSHPGLSGTGRSLQGKGRMRAEVQRDLRIQSAIIIADEGGPSSGRHVRSRNVNSEL